MEQPELEEQLRILVNRFLSEGGSVAEVLAAFDLVQDEIEDDG